MEHQHYKKPSQSHAPIFLCILKKRQTNSTPNLTEQGLLGDEYNNSFALLSTCKAHRSGFNYQDLLLVKAIFSMCIPLQVISFHTLPPSPYDITPLCFAQTLISLSPEKNTPSPRSSPSHTKPLSVYHLDLILTICPK